MNWTEKYRPKIFSEIVGQEEAVAKVKKFVEDFHSGKSAKRRKKALFLHGSPGTGKTTIAFAAANETNSEIFELNASDLRNKINLQEVLRPAVEQQSLLKKKKIILIDEVDGISGFYDKGGILEILSLIEVTSYPVIITANDPWVKKLSTLRKKTEMIKLKEINYKVIKDVLIEILRKENKFLNNNILTEISIKSRGDLRAAINDLQREASLKSLETSPVLDERNKEGDIFNALRSVFKGKPSNEILGIFDSLNMGIDEVMLWIEKNIPLEYHGKELERAFDLLSKADVFKGRIYKQQYWRFLVYENIFLSYGISSSKNPSRVPQGFTSYQKPDRILKIWINNQKIIRKKAIAEKYARYVHIGKKRAEREFPMVVKILKKPEVRKEIKLNEEEVEYLREI